MITYCEICHKAKYISWVETGQRPIHLPKVDEDAWCNCPLDEKFLEKALETNASEPLSLSTEPRVLTIGKEAAEAIQSQPQRVPIKIKRLTDDAHMPSYAHHGDSGADLYATQACTLLPFERRAIPTGLCAEVPPGLEIQIRPKSGIALSQGITVLNTPGTIDAGYRGEIQVILINLNAHLTVSIDKGQKIAQMVVCPVVYADFEEVESLAASERGMNGFGSTGTR